MHFSITRRALIAGGGALVPAIVLGQAPKPSPDSAAQVATPPSVISSPPRLWGSGAPPMISPDPDIISYDPSFGPLRIGQATLQRIATGFEFLEGPAWSAQGQYAIFSDVKNDTLYRYIWETKEVSAFRRPSYGTNGNTFDHQGRQISTQDFFRRVVRWEHDGSLKVLADAYQGKPLNSPNDLAAHPDGSVWFTDPSYGGSIAEGHPDQGDSLGNPGGVRDPALGDRGTGLIGGMHQVLPLNVYRIDPDGRVDVVLPFQTGLGPNGICFSPDYTKVYIIRGGGIWVGDIKGPHIANLRQFTDCTIDEVGCRPDGMRADKAGNIWASSSAKLGYAGVTVWNPTGKLIGRIRLPEGCANMCFAGPKRDYLLMTATQSLYMLHLNIQGAAPG
jgi:gluconolactonase